MHHFFYFSCNLELAQRSFCTAFCRKPFFFKSKFVFVDQLRKISYVIVQIQIFSYIVPAVILMFHDVKMSQNISVINYKLCGA